jgi:predicted nucleotidyltransferase
MNDLKKTGLSEETISKINNIFSAYSKVNKVILYGSRAMGTAGNGSDIDLTIDSQELTLTSLLKIENEIDELLLPYKIDLSIMQKIDNEQLLSHIQRVGIIFYQK